MLGAGAINVSGLKTITIRNLALALRSVQLVLRLVPYVLLHFQGCYSERSKTSMSNEQAQPVTPTPVNPRAESRQFEVLQRQFDNAGKHLRNHVEEANGKILSVVDGFTARHIHDWKPPPQIPSAGFKVCLCTSTTKIDQPSYSY